MNNTRKEAETIKIRVPDTDQPVRIDKFISDQIEALSRSRIQKLLEEGQIILNGTSLKRSNEKVHPGDEIIIELPPLEPAGIQPQEIPIDILYQDEHLSVINKDAGISVHPAGGETTGTLVNALLYHIQDLSGIGGVERPGIVHRLDRVTSGVIMIAKHDEVHQKLSSMFKERLIRKVYWALVHGAVTPPEGEINQPIGRHANDRKRMTIRQDGRESVTRYKVLKTGLGGTLVEVYPLTGRTHQIRVHLKHLGCPIIGDPVYQAKRYVNRGQLERMFKNYCGIGLHAKSLTFRHPVTDEEMFFEAPLPEPFKTVVDQMV